MEPLSAQIKRTLTAYVERVAGVCPELKPSKKAHLASSAFWRGGADGAARLLNERADECTLFGVPLLRSVEVENGWLLFFFTTDALNAAAQRLPDAEEPDGTYFARRLWMYARHDDAPVPDDPSVLQGFFAALFGQSDGERLFLSAPRQKDGMERVRLEQRMSRLAKLLLYERRYTR